MGGSSHPRNIPGFDSPPLQSIRFMFGGKKHVYSRRAAGESFQTSQGVGTVARAWRRTQDYSNYLESQFVLQKIQYLFLYRFMSHFLRYELEGPGIVGLCWVGVESNICCVSTYMDLEQTRLRLPVFMTCHDPALKSFGPWVSPS